MSRFTITPHTLASSAVSVVLLSACSGYSPGDLRVGASETDFRTHMGEPTARYALADGGSKIEYARGPMGKHTYMIDVDAAGRVREASYASDPQCDDMRRDKD